MSAESVCFQNDLRTGIVQSLVTGSGSGTGQGKESKGSIVDGRRRCFGRRIETAALYKLDNYPRLRNAVHVLRQSSYKVVAESEGGGECM